MITSEHLCSYAAWSNDTERVIVTTMKSIAIMFPVTLDFKRMIIFTRIEETMEVPRGITVDSHMATF